MLRRILRLHQFYITNYGYFEVGFSVFAEMIMHLVLTVMLAL